jgi:hypothetical protein
MRIRFLTVRQSEKTALRSDRRAEFEVYNKFGSESG